MPGGEDRGRDGPRRDEIGVARDLRPAAGEHRLICQAIRARGPEHARRAMLEHLRRAERSQTEEVEEEVR